MREERWTVVTRALLILLALAALLAGIFDWPVGRWGMLAGGVFLLLAACFSGLWRDRRLSRFANTICDTVDALMEGRTPENLAPYEETSASKVQEKLLHYYDKMQEEHAQSLADKETIQELVSDISHQVKTPVANLRMFGDILAARELPRERQQEFLALMAQQTEKLDFLMASLVKMSRLETGTFTLQPQEGRLAETIARAMSTVWAKAEEKQLALSVDCDETLVLRHDSKWTAEALANILDNAVKYTPAGGAIAVTVRPWQFYTRVDIADTGIGIPENEINRIFQRFMRGSGVAAEEGVGLGLYLARSIVSLQNGYITVRSTPGAGSVFSVFLLSE